MFGGISEASQVFVCTESTAGLIGGDQFTCSVGAERR